MKKRIAITLTVAIMLISFASCGKVSTDPTTAATSAIQVTSATETTTIISAETTTSAATETTTKANPNQTTSAKATTIQSTTAILTTKAPTTKATTAKVVTTTAPTTEKITTFTSAELSNFDGKNGRKAYIAYEGTVYDVTDNASWSNGNHKYILFAGNDLTAKVNNCTKHIISFMKAQFSTYPKVGSYIG